MRRLRNLKIAVLNLSRQFFNDGSDIHFAEFAFLAAAQSNRIFSASLPPTTAR
jgi:hypothetical protein